MVLVFEVVFSTLVHLCGVEEVRGGKPCKGRLKQPFGQKRQCCVQYVTYVHWHNPHCKLRLSYALIRSLTPHAVLLMPLRGHTGLKMHPHGLTMLGMNGNKC